MKSKLIPTALLAAAAFTSLAAYAETFNPYLWEQMNMPSTRTRAEVKAEMLQAQQIAKSAAADSASRLAQEKAGASIVDKSGTSAYIPAELVKTSQQ